MESTGPTSPKVVERRKRLSLACNECRRKKIKCDGAKPACGKCDKFHLDCVYSSLAKKRGPRQGHIDLLEQRLKKMEELITAQPQQQQRKHVSSSMATSSQPAPVTDIQSEDDLPPKEIILDLTDVFFKHLEVLSPIADVHGVKSKIRNNTCNRFLLYCILSVAARFSTDPNIAKYPLWAAGETYAKKARAMIGTVIEEPTVEHIQGLLILTLNEYGLARESRCWMYAGIAIRMVLELGFHKDLIYDEIPGVVIPTERWYWYETRRKLFWDAFLHEKMISASTGRPQMLDYRDCDLLLPTYDCSLNFASNKMIEIYQRNLDWTKLIRYTTCRNDMGEVTGIQITPLEVPLPGQHPLFSRIELKSHTTELYVFLGKVSELINRGYKDMDLSVQLDIEKLNQDLDVWESRLRPDQKYTPANLEQYIQQSTPEGAHFILAHVFYNALIVLLNRASLVIADMPKFASTTQELKDKVIHNKSRCLAAADMITSMLNDFGSKFDVIPPPTIYFIYISATVIINNSFSVDPEESRRAEDALNEYYKFFEGMKLYWVDSEKMFFLMRDLYALHRKVISAHHLNNSSGSIGSVNTTSEDSSSIVLNNNNDSRRLPLADIALSSSTDWLLNNNTTNITNFNLNNPYIGYGQVLQPSFNNNMIRNNPMDIYSGSSGFTSFDVWLEQQQENRRAL